MGSNAKYLVEVTCTICGKAISRNKHELKRRGKTQREKRHYCSDECRIKGFSGELSPGWKGGLDHRAKGYIGIKVSPDDFFFPMADHHGYVLEHRLVMARSLNRRLLTWEIVHHKNGMKNDNRIENLAILSTQAKHLGLTRLTTDNKTLRARVDVLEKEIKLLKWQVKELNKVKYEQRRI